MLTNKPLDDPPALCRLLTSAVKNCWSVAVESLELLLVDAPNAESRFSKSLSSVLAAEVVLDVALDVLLAVVSVDVLLELDDSDCARLSRAEARSLP